MEACIIDFTLSRITNDGVVVYNDLSQDEELFTAEGDYQFEIYRMMQQKNGYVKCFYISLRTVYKFSYFYCFRNEWQHFEPYTNVLWLDYVLDKMISGVHYSYPKSKIHRSYMQKLREIQKTILDFNSVKSLVTSLFF